MSGANRPTIKPTKTSDPVRVLEKHDSPQMEKLETWMGQNVWETSAKHMESHLFGTPMYV
jgi:hypothetical protein